MTDEIERMRSIRELLIKALMVATGAPEADIREAPLTVAIKFRKTLSGVAQCALESSTSYPAETAMTAQGALEIAANIAEDRGWMGKPYPGVEIAKAIRDVAKKGYWTRDSALTPTPSEPAPSSWGTLERIAIVCTDNMDRNCDHRMALDFVRQIANDALDDSAVTSTVDQAVEKTDGGAS